MARNELLKRQLSLFDTAFVNRQCKLLRPSEANEVQCSSLDLVLRLLATSEEIMPSMMKKTK